MQITAQPLAGSHNARTSATGQAATENTGAASFAAVLQDVEKLAAHPGWASEYQPWVKVLNGPGSERVGYFAEVENFKNSHRAELAEYDQLFNSHFEQTRAEFGLNTQDAYYNKVIRGQHSDTEFRTRFEGRIRNDARMMTLMNTLGIKPPV